MILLGNPNHDLDRPKNGTVSVNKIQFYLLSLFGSLK